MTNKRITKVKRRRDESQQSYLDRQRKLDELLKSSAGEEKRRLREEFKEPPETALTIIFCGIATVFVVMLIRGDIRFNQKTADVPDKKPYETVIDDANGTRAKKRSAEMAAEAESRNRLLRYEAVNQKCHSSAFFNTPECQAYVNGIPGSSDKVSIP
jgi:hypothetical protein